MSKFRKIFWFNEHCDHISVEMCFKPAIGAGFNIDEGITFSINLLFLTIYITIEMKILRKFVYANEDRRCDIKLYLSNGEVFFDFSFWHDDCGWRDKEWKGLHRFVNVTAKLKGKSKHVCEILEQRDLCIPMPEKSYPAKITLEKRTNYYPRWFKQEWYTCNIDLNSNPIPEAGKGENSWDCGDDATHSMSVSAKTIPEGIGKCVGSLLRSRIKYGGWQDFYWKTSDTMVKE